MIIEFKSDDSHQYKGFSASIYFTPVPIKKCESWLDIKKSIFKSPNHPQIYYDSIKCSWLITVDPDYHITLDIFDFYVRYQIQNHDILDTFRNLYQYLLSLILKLQIEADTAFLLVYDGGSEQAEIIGNFDKEINDVKISTPRNQLFVVFHTNGKNASIRLNAKVIKSK